MTKDTGQPLVYWLPYKTQLIRAAPHHVRADFTSAATQVEDARQARKEVSALKSRGVTRFLDLDKANKINLDDLLEEDIGHGSEADADNLQPPLQRHRLMDTEAPLDLDMDDGLGRTVVDAALGPPPVDFEYSPGTPIPDDDMPEMNNPHYQPLEPLDDDEPEPNQEPSGTPTPAARSLPTLDPATAALYEPARPNEDFLQRRLRLRPRRRLHDLDFEKELPFTLDQFDPIRVTMMRMPNGQTLISTDNLSNKTAPMTTAWTGITVYQLNGKIRKEFAMYSSLPAKKAARQQKHAMAKHMAKKPELSERNISLWEKQQC